MQHYQTKVEPNGFKAQVVVFDRECCVLYKKVMDELIGPEASAVVMSSAQHDKPEWKEHIRDKDAEEKLLDCFRDPLDPLKFVIVTSKLLTGFDAPILQSMYLDKPLKGHNLLQAICRVNRTYGLSKTHGLIVDYIGIFDDVAQALNFDEKSVQQVVSNIEELRKALPVQGQKCLAFFPMWTAVSVATRVSWLPRIDCPTTRQGTSLPANIVCLARSGRRYLPILA